MNTSTRVYREGISRERMDLCWFASRSRGNNGNTFMTRSQPLRQGGLDSRVMRHVIVVLEEMYLHRGCGEEEVLMSKKRLHDSPVYHIARRIPNMPEHICAKH